MHETCERRVEANMGLTFPHSPRVVLSAQIRTFAHCANPMTAAMVLDARFKTQECHRYGKNGQPYANRLLPLVVITSNTPLQVHKALPEEERLRMESRQHGTALRHDTLNSAFFSIFHGSDGSFSNCTPVCRHLVWVKRIDSHM